MKVVEFMRASKDAPGAPVYLFCPGKSAPRAKMATFEDFLAERAVEAFIDQHVDPANRDFAFAAFYADETSPQSIVMEAQTMPFLTDRRVILVRNAEKYNTESAAGPMMAYLENPNETTVLLMIAGKVDKRTKFYKLCDKAGEIVECPSLTEGECKQWVRHEVESRGFTIEATAVEELVRRTGTHLSDVNNALTLVINFLGQEGQTIREKDVIAACADVAEEEVWALTDAIAASRPGDALTSLQRLTDLGKHPDELIGTINWLLKSAYAVANTQGNPAINSFVAQKVRPLAEKLGVTKLRAAFALCTDTQFMMRTTGSDAGLALELLVVKLAAPIPRRRSA